MPLNPIKFPVGSMWLQKFDVLVQRGMAPRDVVVEMAKEMDRLGDLAVKRVEAAPLPVYSCPHCGKLYA
jgi:hypothetical protein